MSWNVLKKLGRLAVIPGALVAAGCFLQTISGVFAVRDGSLIISLRTDAMLTTCVDRGSGNLECSYFFFDANGVPVSTTSSAQLISEFGILGLLIDPLIVQLPDDLRINAATYDTGAGPQPLEVIVTGSVPVDAETTMVAEPGQKFAILELPDVVGPTLPPGDALNGLASALAIELERTRAPEALSEPFEIKAMFTIPFQVGTTVYYLPMLPCVTDFSQVPAIQIDPATPNQDLLGLASALALAGQTCNDQPYDFFQLGPLALPSVGELDFGPVLLGESRARVLTLNSGGFSDLSVSSIQAPADAAYSILRDDCTGMTVPPGQGCEVELRFQPSAAGSVNDSMTFMTNDFSIPTTQVLLAGEGTTLLSDAGTSCDVVDFGPVGEGAARTYRHTLWNSGGSNLAIGQVMLADLVNFSIARDECGGVVVEPSFGCHIDVVYQPTAAGVHATQLTVLSNDPGGDIVVNLAGEGGADLIFGGGFEDLCVASAP